MNVHPLFTMFGAGAVGLLFASVALSLVRNLPAYSRISYVGICGLLCMLLVVGSHISKRVFWNEASARVLRSEQLCRHNRDSHARCTEQTRLWTSAWIVDVDFSDKDTQRRTARLLLDARDFNNIKLQDYRDGKPYDILKPDDKIEIAYSRRDPSGSIDSVQGLKSETFPYVLGCIVAGFVLLVVTAGFAARKEASGLHD
jgi:hypothetical protein